MGTHTYSKFAALTAAIMLLAGQSAQAWWNKEWNVRKKITVDTTSTGAEITDPIGSGVVLVRLHQGNYQFAAGREDGADIRFVDADDKTLLPFHIEKFDALMNEAFAWVRVPDIKPGEQKTIWMYYGNPGEGCGERSGLQEDLQRGCRTRAASR